MLTRDGRSLIVASLDHNQLAELYAVRTELEGLAARLAARHATEEEIRVLRGMVEDDRALLGGDPRALSRANKRFHKQIHLASHNRFLVQQLDLVHRSMALMATTSFAAEGRDEVAMAEHEQIVQAIEARDGEAAYAALRNHISSLRDPAPGGCGRAAHALTADQAGCRRGRPRAWASKTPWQVLSQ